MTDIFSNIEQKIENIDAKIESIVENATDSKNYEKLNQKINDMVSQSTSAFDEGYTRAEKVVKTQSEKFKTSVDIQQEKIKKHTEALKKPLKKDFITKKEGVYAGGMAMAIVGFTLAALLGIGILAMHFLSTIGFAGIWLTINRIILVPGLIIFFLVGIMGRVIMVRVARFKKYTQVLEGKMSADVSELATSVNKSVTFVRKDLKKMIVANWFKEGHLTHDETTLIVSKAVYEAYKINEQHRLLTKHQQEQIQQIHEQLPIQARMIIKKSEDLIKEIHENKVAISEYEMTIKLSHLESVLKKIFKRVGLHPEVVPATRKMMDYYLPTTIKLLEAYVQLDKQAIQGNNILSAKTEIEGSLDTLISAYEKLLDDLFEDVMLDVSTDITVLNTILAQDGLANGDFENINKRGYK